MPKNVVVHSRIRPQVRKINQVINLPKTVQVIPKPSQPQPVQINEVKPIQKGPKQATISRNRSNQVSRKRTHQKGIRKSTKITYSSRNPTPESKPKINQLRGTGKGKILVIIGNGPSINEIDLKPLKTAKNVELLSINKPHPDVWPTEYWSFFDRTQYRRYEDMWKTYGGYIFNSTSITEQKQKSMQFKQLGGVGFSNDVSNGIYIGRSSVYASMQIAKWIGFEQVYILGCDMNPEGINGQLHYYGVNPDVEPKLRASRFEREAGSYNYAAEHLEEADRKKFVFCSDYNPWPFVDAFDRLSHKTAVNTIIEKSKLLS